MKRQLIQTKDHSYTLFVPELDEHYHSIHGAMQEAEHVFLNAGLLPIATNKKEIRILEIGFGTGLNTWLTCLSADVNKLNIHYTGLEKYPVQEPEWSALSYAERMPERYAATSLNPKALFDHMHEIPWEAPVALSDNFHLTKVQIDFKDFSALEAFDLIYYDAFAPSAQANLWTVELFTNMFQALKPRGVLVTYCVKGEVRRNMQAAGFLVEKIPGPPGKREMARAYKP
jgi:tRNA U34 5-methylaminomethyl-2-thiouridine-forming methyltransferase MnmC